MTRSRQLLTGSALALLLVGAGCSAAEDPEPQIADLDFEPVATLVVDDQGFDSDELELTTGDSITLVNEGDAPHSFVAAEPFRDTGELLPGEEVLLRFDEADEIEAYDGTDPEQTVTIVVTEDPDEDAGD